MHIFSFKLTIFKESEFTIKMTHQESWKIGKRLGIATAELRARCDFFVYYTHLFLPRYIDRTMPIFFLCAISSFVTGETPAGNIEFTSLVHDFRESSKYFIGMALGGVLCRMYRLLFHILARAVAGKIFTLKDIYIRRICLRMESGRTSSWKILFHFL